MKLLELRGGKVAGAPLRGDHSARATPNFGVQTKSALLRQG